jgi:hypothetical protein
MKLARKNTHESFIIDLEELPLCPEVPPVPVLPE